MILLGSGNFDSDSAHATLGFLLQDISDTIRETFSLDSEDSLYDGLGEGDIMGNIDIYLTLCKHYKVSAYGFKQSDEIIQWKQNYLDTFKRICHLNDVEQDLMEARMVVIAETFDSLHSFVKEMLED